jgi:HPt (histidine-containing phosphotransfer) domain-containing protein
MGRPPYRLPDTLAASLERAFAGEVAERLPRLLAAAEELGEVGDAASRAASAAHALASSAAVMGQDDAAKAARECERLLAPYAAQGEVPAPVAGAAADAADAVRVALRPWTQAGPEIPAIPEQP